MIIRRATRADATAVGDLTRNVYVDGGFADPATAPEYVRSLSDGLSRITATGVSVLVAAEDDTIVGSVTATRAGSPVSNLARAGELEVRMLAVAPDFRRRGVAAALMKACEDEAARAGLTAIVLSTDPRMTEAHRLYEARGYHRTPERDWTIDGVDLLTYRRDHPPGTAAVSP